VNIFSYESQREHDRGFFMSALHGLAFYCSILSFLMDIFGLCNSSQLTPASIYCKNVLKRLWHLRLTAAFPSRGQRSAGQMTQGFQRNFWTSAELAAPNISLPWMNMSVSVSDNNGDGSWHATTKATESISFSSLSHWYLQLYTHTHTR